MRKYYFLILILFLSFSPSIFGQTTEITKGIRRFLSNYTPKDQKIAPKPKMLSARVSNNNRKIYIVVNEHFASQNFTPESVDSIYIGIKAELPAKYNNYDIEIKTNGYTIEELIPNRLKTEKDPKRQWGDIEYNGKPWVTNISLPYTITRGLHNRHISLWASHGRYYDWNKGKWKWQRPNLFGTTEDLFTPTVVVTYLIPMLEKAGANVFTPRERDWQKNEIIVDNDLKDSSYQEQATKYDWQTSDSLGFSYHKGTYADGENPFQAGTARMTQTTSNPNELSQISYQPIFKQDGSYAVYVSYLSLDNSVDDAHYTVWHRGQKTEFKVNQKIGGSTWVYLGTFDFASGNSQDNRVVLNNYSKSKGIVTADGVRFGGGMGNIEREGTVSKMPRALEGARYTAQWSGMPYEIYGSRNGTDDYSDDINTRSLMTNYLAGGSCYAPNTYGKKVPIELVLAVHSDAGYDKEGKGLIGTLSICTTKHNEGITDAGISRLASRDFADALLSNTYDELRRIYGRWNKRQLYDRNYSETRMPAMPSAIIETMSHQNFPDMRMGQDPNFKFNMARSMYKTILKYISEQHNTQYEVTPLAPSDFRISMTNGKATLSWSETTDTIEPTAVTTGYVVYACEDDKGYDNGTLVKNKKDLTISLKANKLYRFKVAAINSGGESFPTEELCAYYNPNATQTIMIINGFHRLSAPKIIDNDSIQGFFFDDDPGLSYGKTPGWVGRQKGIMKEEIGVLEDYGLGYSNDDFTGMFIAGNERNYVSTHARAIISSANYNIVSASSKAIEKQIVDLTNYPMVDLILGTQQSDTTYFDNYKTFTPSMQNALSGYTQSGGCLFISGANVGSDMIHDADSAFLANTLKCQFTGNIATSSNKVHGMGTTLSFYNSINELHYPAVSPDILRPITPAFVALRYEDESDACIAYKGDTYRTFVLGFPFECIDNSQRQKDIMGAIINFLLK